MHVWVSFISWYVYMLGGMSLTCLPIFAWQWGRKHNNTEENEAFWLKPHSCLILWQPVCFLLQKFVFFTNGVYHVFHHNSMCLWFCKTVLVKKCTPYQGVVWFSPSKCHIFYTGFSGVLYLHNWSPLIMKPQNKLQKSRGRCPRAPAGAYAPRTLRTQVLKKWPPSQLVFAVCTSPKV